MITGADVLGVLTLGGLIYLGKKYWYDKRAARVARKKGGSLPKDLPGSTKK